MWYCSMDCRAALLDSEKSCCTLMPLPVDRVGSRLIQASLVGANTVSVRLGSLRYSACSRATLVAEKD